MRQLQEARGRDKQIEPTRVVREMRRDERNKKNVGKAVRFINSNIHTINPDWYKRQNAHDKSSFVCALITTHAPPAKNDISK